MPLLRNASPISESSSRNIEYSCFRASVPLKQVVIEEYGIQRRWLYFEAGPKNATPPLLFLPPLSGGADVYYKQILSLSAAGCHVVSVEMPIYWSVRGFCRGLEAFLDAVQLERVHIFGASLGGYLAQKFAELFPSRVASLLLCNSFTNTVIFKRQEAVFFYWALPSLILKRIILGGFPRGALETSVADSIDFMVDQLESMNQEQLAARMTLNSAHSSCDTKKLSHLLITIINVMDNCALNESVREDILHRYPAARRAEMKSGGNFPFLSRSADVNLHIKVHLARFDGTSLSARHDFTPVTP